MVVDQLPRLGKRELICLLLFTCNYVVFVWRGFFFLWVLGMGYVILLWHSLSLPYNYKTLKQVLGVNRYTSTLAVRLECCRYPIIPFCISLMYKYFIRFRNMPQNRILYSAFITDQELHCDISKSWYSNLAMITKL